MHISTNTIFLKKMSFYLHVFRPPLLLGHPPVGVEDRVVREEDEDRLPVRLHQAVDVGQRGRLVLDPVEAVEREHLGELSGHPAGRDGAANVQVGEGDVTAAVSEEDEG